MAHSGSARHQEMEESRGRLGKVGKSLGAWRAVPRAVRNIRRTRGPVPWEATWGL